MVIQTITTTTVIDASTTVAVTQSSLNIFIFYILELGVVILISYFIYKFLKW